MRQIDIQCICGNKLTATVFKNIPFDLTCSKCDNNFVEEQTPDGKQGRVFFITKTSEFTKAVVEFKDGIESKDL